MFDGVQNRSTPFAGPEKTLILAVCPDEDDLNSLKTILEPELWMVRCALSCGEAVRAVRAEAPAVIACENELPDGNWKDLMRLLIALEDPPPLVVVSRFADENLWAEVLNMGGYDLLSKPFERSEVARVMQMARRYGRAAQVARG